jgi:2-aminoadipate transaminase
MNYKFSDKVSGLEASAIREILKFTAVPDVISFAAGNPSPEAFPCAEVENIAADILRSNPVSALQYSITEGYTPLRDTMKKRLAEQNCHNPLIDDLIITSGGQQGNELSCKVFLNDGDTLICETPSFIGSINSFRSYNANLVGVPMEDDGIRVDELEDALKLNPDAKMIYLIPNFQNPTGLCLSFEKRKKLYALAQTYDLIILEDNPYGELRFDGEDIPSIKSLDTDGRVIYVGSFSKILAPGIRVGFVSAPKDIIQKIVVCKQVSDVHTNILAQIICDRFMNDYDIDAHVKRLKGLYKRKCELMLACAARYFSESVTLTKPRGGFFIWASLPDGCDMSAFCKRAVEEYRVAVVPGDAFLIGKDEKTNSFRLNFSTPTDEQIMKGCEILGRLSMELLP